MQVLRYQHHFELVLFKPEAFLLRSSLEQILKNYRAQPEELPPAARDLWFKHDHQLDEEDHEIWLQNLREYRGENSRLVEQLLKETSVRDVWPQVIVIPVDQADSFITIINDHRLYLAAVNGVGEKEMNEDWEISDKSPGKMAVMNIHFLAWLIEIFLIRMNETSHGSQE